MRLCLGLLFLAMASGQDPGSVFEDDFSRESIARKPAHTVVARTRAPDRGVQNPSIVEGRDGVLIAAWSNKQMADGHWMDNHPSNTLDSSYSSDGGSPGALQAAASGRGSINAAFLRDPRTDDLLLLYNANHSEIQDDTSIAYRKSADNGKTWGPPVALDTGFPVDVLVHSGIVMSTGEWLAPFHYDRSRQQHPFSVRNADFVAAVAISADRGATWRRFGAVEVPNLWKHTNGNNWAVETGVAETRGELVMILRTRTGYLYRATSSDKGRTLAQGRAADVQQPRFQAHRDRASERQSAVDVEQYPNQEHPLSADGFSFPRRRPDLARDPHRR